MCDVLCLPSLPFPTFSAIMWKIVLSIICFGVCIKFLFSALLFLFYFEFCRPHDEVVPDDVIIAKRLRAAREKSRRDKLNNSFQELQNVIGKALVLCFHFV